MNEIKKRKMQNINSPNDINIISPLSALESRKVLYFQKINSLNDINTFGSQPVIVYKKTPKHNNYNPKSPKQLIPKNSKKLKNDLNKYISDEKIGKKLQKFNSFSNIPHQKNKNIKIKKTKSCTGNIILIEQDQKLKEEKERKKNINEQKLFSKTVRESNMRPVFPKNKNRQFNLTKNCFNIKNCCNENEHINLNREKREKEKENSKEQEIKKSIIMNQLVENAVAIEIKKYQNNKSSKNSIEAIKNAKKRECLEENGITTSTEEITENENNNEVNNENTQEKNRKKLSNILFSKTNNFISPEDITHPNMPPFQSNQPKTKNKPYIEQFEFLQKIKEEQKKLIAAPKKNNSFSKNENYNYSNSNYNNYNHNYNNYNSNQIIHPQITDSFRKKNKNMYEVKNKIINDRNDKNSYSLEDRKNHRSTREINKYLKEKKIKLKQNEESKQLEKNKKLFLRFKNLYNLNMKDYNDLAKTVSSHKNKQQTIINYNNINQKHKKFKSNIMQNNQIEERKDDKINVNINKNNKNSYTISNKFYNYNTYVNNNKYIIQNNNNNNNTNNIRKKKEINEYYIGNDSTLRNNNNSTVVDANEYFLNVLESQQLLVNSRLKKINNDTDTNQNINVQENIDNENYDSNNENIKIENYTNNNETNYNDTNNNNNNNTNNNDINNLIINNELTVSKEQIRKITDKEKTKSSNSKKSADILNTSNLEELKQKINITLKRANLFFSKEVMENYKQNILNNFTENSNINIDTSNKSNKKSNINTNNDDENLCQEENKQEKVEEVDLEIEKEPEKSESEKGPIIESENENKEENKKMNNYLNNEDMKQKPSEIKIETVDINNNNNVQIENINLNKNDIKNINSENITNGENSENLNLEILEEKNTKEKNLTSLSHTFTNNSNPNKKVEIAIEPRAVLNLVEIIKFIIQRKIFVILYESYINHAIYQQYNIAFSFFVAICKQYPFKKLEEYYNYKTYNYAFRQLFRPFNRKNFKYFLNCFHMRKKVEYLVSLLTKMIKFKTMERIYIYGQYFQEDDEEKAFKMIIMKIMYTLIRPHLYEVFTQLRNNIYQDNQNNIDENKLEEENKEENKDENNDSEVNFNISDDDDNMNININDNSNNEINENEDNEVDENNNIKINDNNNNENNDIENNDIETNDNNNENNDIELNDKNNENNDNEIKENNNGKNIEISENIIDIKNQECNIENNNNKEKLKENFDSNNLNNIKNILNNNVNENLQNEFMDNIKIEENDENINNYSIENHRRKNDSSLKMNSFLYESLDSDEKSSISVEPNSVDNDKLHQLKMLLIAKNKNFENGIDDNYINSDNENDIDLNYEINNNSQSSKKSGKSLQDIINMKIGKNINKTLSDMMEDNSFQKSASQNTIDDLQKNLSGQLSNNSKNKENDKENIHIKNNSNSNISLNSIGYKNKNEGAKNEEIKMNNDTKDTKEVTEDSNTININTNTNNKSDTKSNIKTNEINSDIKPSNNINVINIKINDSQKKIEFDNKEKIEKGSNNKVNIEEDKDNNSKEYNTFKDNKKINSKVNKEVIELEYNIPRNNLKSKLLKNYKIIENDEEFKSESNIKSKELSEEKKSTINEEILKLENKKIKIPLIKIINDSNDSTSENKNSKEELKTKNKFNNIYDNKEKFAEELVSQIMNNIIFTEIKSSKIKLLPNKKYKFDKFLKKSTNNNNSSQSQNNSLTNSCNSAGNIRDSHHSGSSINQLSLHEDLFSLNDSMNSNYSVYSVFNKTIKDKKKEHSLNLYFNNICPKLISYLHKEIIKKYPRILDNISCQKKNISENLMISLVLQDAQMLRSNYKKLCYKENLEKIIDKKEMLKNFSSINRKIRQDDNITSDNYYDNMLNECVLETAIELIEKERFYGDNGEPLKWSSRTREIAFKYGKNDAKKFADYICKNILKIIHNRIGLINDNYSYMNQDEINYEREKRLLDTIKGDLNRNESQWKNLEMEETQLKVESTEMILDQLYNEVIEILEHIQFNRINPELYQFKSIYACEEIPKLSFQQTTTEDVGIPEGEENDFMNI